jgi:hypothetical protein
MAKNKQKSTKRSGAASAGIKSRDMRKPVKQVKSIDNLVQPNLLGVSNMSNSLGTGVQPSKLSVTISVEFGTSS